MNNNTLFSILLVAFGVLIGFIVAFVINSLKVNKAAKKAETLINQAKKDVEKIKRDAAIEQFMAHCKIRTEFLETIIRNELRTRNSTEKACSFKRQMLSV